MAKSGSFTGSTNNEYVVPKITWSATQSVSGNYSDVTATLTYSRTNTGFTTGGTWNGSITINGTKATGSKYIEITHNSNTVALTAKTRVYHKTDGSKSITISASGSISGTTLSSTTISKTVTLDTIPRATTPTFSASSVYMGSGVTINLNSADKDFTHRLTYSFGSLSGKTEGIGTPTGVYVSTVFTPPLTLANQIPKATSGTCTVTCKTYSGNTLIGTKTATLTLKVPTSVAPTISSVSVKEATAGIADKFGVYVQQKSKLSVAISASGASGSTISSYKTTIQSTVYNGSTFTSKVLTASGTVTLKTTVTDSRGRTASRETDITVVAYSPPRITSISAYRIDTSGNASDEGERIAISVKYSVASVSGKNTRTYKVSYKKYGAASFANIASTTAATSYDGVLKYTSSPSISIDHSYTVKFELSDYFTKVSYNAEIPSAFTCMDFRYTGKGVAFGKASERDALEVAMDVYFRNNATVNGEVVLNGKRVDNQSVTLTAKTDRITDVSYTAKYNELLGAVFVRIYGKISAAMSAGYGYTLFDIGSKLPNSNVALSVKIGTDDSTAITKRAAAYAKTSGAINIQPLDGDLNGYDVYITGFWFV